MAQIEKIEKKTVTKQSKNFEYMAEHGRKLASEIVQYESFRDPDAFVIPYSITDPILKSIHLVESYVSDILISFETLRKEILNPDGPADIPVYVVFGLRESGVDGNEFCNSRIHDWNRSKNFSSKNDYYRKIFIIKIQNTEEGVALALYDATHHIPYSELDPEES